MARNRPGWRRSSWAHAGAADPMKAARAAWETTPRHEGEQADPPSAVLARAFADPLGGEFAQLADNLLRPIAAVMEPTRV